ncbi:MAG: protease modulator HflK [Planctomycetota bacterium]|jgi:membrane protease subunit HflK
MAELNNEDKKNLAPVPGAARPGEEFDAASKSLSEALRMSFVILKIIMIVLIGLFLVSGFERVDSDEQAIVLRFGKIRGVGEDRLLNPGLHWILPYPVDEMVKIPVRAKVHLPVNTFWYFQTKEDMLSEARPRVRPGMGLRPLLDGYCLTRSEEAAGATTGSDGSDYNIVHTKWQLTYQIDDPERFFSNMHVADVTPGEDYFKVITGERGIKPLMESLFEDAVVTALVNYTIDEAIASDEKITPHVERLLQEKLDTIESGIKVESVQLTRSEPPPHTREAFAAPTKASQDSQRDITQARTYAAETLNEAAGPDAERLHAALNDETIDAQAMELLWQDLGGTARQKMADAEAYRARVVETAKANADYLQRLLPEYRQRPKLVLQKIYLDAITRIFAHAEETYLVQSAEDGRDREIRVAISRDPLLKPKKKEAPVTGAGQ